MHPKPNKQLINLTMSYEQENKLWMQMLVFLEESNLFTICF